MAVEYEARTDAEGLVLVGEVTTRTMREAISEPDYRNASIAGATAVLEEVILFAQARIDAAGPYDDVRLLEELKVYLADKIRSVHSTATNGKD